MDTMQEGIDAVRAQGEEIAGNVTEAAGRASKKVEELAGNMTDAAGRASKKVQDSLSYLRERNFNEIADDVQGLVRRYPGGSMLVAAAVGFLAAQYIRSNRQVDREYGR